MEKYPCFHIWFNIEWREEADTRDENLSEIEQKEDIRRGSNYENWKVPEFPEKCRKLTKWGMGNKLIFISILKERMFSEDKRLGNTHTADSWVVLVINWCFYKW